MIYRQRRGGGPVFCENTERNRGPRRSPNVNMLQPLRVLLQTQLGFHHHVILIERSVHGGNLTLAE